MIARGLRRAGLFVVALLCVAALWELYKAVGPGGGRRDPRLAADPAHQRPGDAAHVGDVASGCSIPRCAAGTRRSGGRSSGTAGTRSGWRSSDCCSAASFGVALAVVMARFKVIERGLLPYVIASQTVPLIALAPQVAAFGGNWDLPKWMWVSTLGAFLAFFPIAVATLKGLSSAPAASLELMDSYAASWWSTLRQAEVPGRDPDDGARPQAGRDGVGDRRDRVGDLHRASAASVSPRSRTARRPRAIRRRCTRRSSARRRSAW